MFKEHYKKMLEEREWILAELLACRSLSEIATNVSHIFIPHPGIERWYYGHYLILEVEFVIEDLKDTPKWVFRVKEK